MDRLAYQQFLEALAEKRLHNREQRNPLSAWARGKLNRALAFDELLGSRALWCYRESLTSILARTLCITRLSKMERSRLRSLRWRWGLAAVVVALLVFGLAGAATVWVASVSQLLAVGVLVLIIWYGQSFVTLAWRTYRTITAFERAPDRVDVSIFAAASSDAGTRTYALYLRGFAEEVDRAERDTEGLGTHIIGELGEGHKLERLLVRACRNTLPLVCVTNPLLPAGVSGATHVRIESEDWVSEVQSLIAGAKLVFLHVGQWSPGLMRERALIGQHRAYGKTVLLRSWRADKRLGQVPRGRPPKYLAVVDIPRAELTWPPILLGLGGVLGLNIFDFAWPLWLLLTLPLFATIVKNFAAKWRTVYQLRRISRTPESPKFSTIGQGGGVTDR